MLKSLSIKNFALIEDLKVNFNEGLSIITGETGAGKSILLGGLALVLGKRADTSLVYDKERKCIVEAEFEIGSYELRSFFDENDLDYDNWVIIRREILPHGKSRSFVNDTPVTLPVLNDLSKQLVDIHSQHETLQLSDRGFQFDIIDALGENETMLESYKNTYDQYKGLKRKLSEFEESQREAQKEYDYNMFLCDELRKAELKSGEMEILEKDLEKLAHIEEIKQNLSGIINLAEQDSMGTLSQLSEMDHQLSRIRGYADLYSSLSERMKSLIIEFKDLLEEVERENDHLVYDPEGLEKVEERLQLLYGLQKKHGARDVDELIGIRDALEIKVSDVEQADFKREQLISEIKSLEKKLEVESTALHRGRMKAIPEFERQIGSSLQGLEMKNTRLKVNLEKTTEFQQNGKDQLEFMMSSDKGKSFESIKKMASGGEMSRMMLAVKWILSKYSKLPAIVFDEIDTGVSGEVSNRIADLMRAMSANMQVITITHLPQVAAKGHHHYKVFKQEAETGITSNIRKLNEEERLLELSEMLGGTKITASAMAHARQLLS